MNKNKVNQKVILLAILFGALFNSCSLEKTDNSKIPNIDLSVLKLNDWEFAGKVCSVINQHRDNLHLELLKKDSSYASAYAIDHCLKMIETNAINHNDFFLRSDGIKKLGAKHVGENIAYGYTSANSVVRAWIKSDHHRKILEGNFKFIGIGIVKSNSGKNYFTLLFYD